MKSFLLLQPVFSCPILSAYLYKVVDHGQRNDDDGEVRSGQTDDKQCPQHAQQTHEPGAEGLWNGFVHCENVLWNQ